MNNTMNSTDSLPIDSPYSIDGRGATAEVAHEAHLRELIELVLFTNPGERVMRPAFGSGILGLVFAPEGPDLGTTSQVLIASALQTWLGDLISVSSVDVVSEDSTLTITVNYVDRSTGDAASVVFGRSV